MPQPNIRDEMSRSAAEPWLPIETKLVSWSLGIGVSLLILLALANHIWPASL